MTNASTLLTQMIAQRPAGNATFRQHAALHLMTGLLARGWQPLDMHDAAAVHRAMATLAVQLADALCDVLAVPDDGK